MKNETKRLATLSVLVALAMILSYVESLIPAFVAIPGVKLGISNIVTVFALYILGAPSAIMLSVVRVSLSALLFGSPVTFIYSLSGAILSFVFMYLLYRIDIFSSVGVSAVGGIMHNAGQVICAALIMENGGIVTYLAPLAVTGTLSGVVIGVVAGILVKRLQKHIKV